MVFKGMTNKYSTKLKREMLHLKYNYGNLLL